VDEDEAPSIPVEELKSDSSPVDEEDDPSSDAVEDDDDDEPNRPSSPVDDDEEVFHSKSKSVPFKPSVPLNSPDDEDDWS
jgi:hypothetical protein